jgi:hypothetical protein
MFLGCTLYSLSAPGSRPVIQLLEEWGQPRPPLLRALASAIERQVARGVLDVPDADVAAHQLTLLILNDGLARSFFGTRKLPQAQLDAIVDNGVDMSLRADLKRKRRRR